MWRTFHGQFQLGIIQGHGDDRGILAPRQEVTNRPLSELMRQGRACHANGVLGGAHLIRPGNGKGVGPPEGVRRFGSRPRGKPGRKPPAFRDFPFRLVPSSRLSGTTRGK